MEVIQGDILLDGGIIKRVFPGGANSGELAELLQVPSTFVDAQGKWVSPG